jgi:hypothetical protein
MYPHTVVLYSRLSDVDGKATWERHLLDDCHAEPLSGIEQALSGERLTGALSVLIHHRSGLVISPKDRMSMTATTAAEPPKDALTVISAAPVYLASSVPHHWEVTAR